MVLTVPELERFRKAMQARALWRPARWRVPDGEVRIRDPN
jgi:hypothetical protein